MIKGQAGNIKEIAKEIKEEKKRAEIEAATDSLRRSAALRNSEFKQSFAAIGHERTKNITTPILIKIVEYHKSIFSYDKDISFVLLELLTERSNSSNNADEQQKIDKIIFSVACTSAYAEVRKQAAAMLEKMADKDEIAELAKKFLA